MEEFQEITITNVKDAFILFENKLNKAAQQLDNSDRVDVERLTTLDGYRLSHPRGIFGLVYSGDSYIKRDDVKSSTLFLKRDMLIGVFSVIRFFDNKSIPLEKQAGNYRMMPSDYTELACDTMSGILVYNNRSEDERLIVPVRTELVDEADGVWKYLTTFSIPMDYVQKSLRE